MKFPRIEVSTQERLDEFDLWITPSLQEIQDTEKFREELEKVDRLIRRLGPATNNFSSIDSCSPEAIAATCVELIEQEIAGSQSEEEKIATAIDLVESLSSLLFLVTGKSDNNLKCQFPVFLSQTEQRPDFPQRRGSRGATFRSASLGRVIKSEKVAKVIAEALVCFSCYDGLEYLEDEAQWLLGKYITAILKDEGSVRQFWALGRSYFSLLDAGDGSEKSLLAPIVIFKVRGSVSASGGHIPENLLRGMMAQWGLESGVDFNVDDVIICSDGGGSSKTRAYDFVLPYQTDGWEPKIFIQCQFYAGDSGSVSHKVVDQTQSSRRLTLEQYPDAKFIEYLDGAGYYSSLNRDLQHMLGLETTKDFIQVRSAHVKLRRELQDSGFLTPVDIEHAIFRSHNGDRGQVISFLESEDYSLNEINRALANAIARGVIVDNDGLLSVKPERKSFARRLLVIDLIANIGAPLAAANVNTGNALIPGFGRLFGVQLTRISQEIDACAPNADYSRNDFAEDITWLAEKKFIILR